MGMQKLADADRLNELCDMLIGAIRSEIKRTEGQWALVGIKKRGDVLAQRVAKALKNNGDDAGDADDFDVDPFAGRVGSVDITMYRDDLSEIGAAATIEQTEIDFPLDDLNVILIDDVLMTGRSIRAALQALIDFGRPRRIWLSVLVDRGGRELPIAADLVGLDLSQVVSPRDHVQVKLKPMDDEEGIYLMSRDGESHLAEGDVDD